MGGNSSKGKASPSDVSTNRPTYATGQNSSYSTSRSPYAASQNTSYPTYRSVPPPRQNTTHFTSGSTCTAGSTSGIRYGTAVSPEGTDYQYSSEFIIEQHLLLNKYKQERQQKSMGKQGQDIFLERELQQRRVEQERQQKLQEQERQQKLLEQERQQRLLERERHQRRLEQERQQKLLEREHQQKLLEEQKQKVLEEQRQRKLIEEQYQQKLQEEQRQKKFLEERLEAQRKKFLEEQEKQKLEEKQFQQHFEQVGVSGKQQKSDMGNPLQKGYLEQFQTKSFEEQKQEEQQQKSCLKRKTEECHPKTMKDLDHKKHLKEIMKVYNITQTQLKCLAPVNNTRLSDGVFKDKLTNNWSSMPPNQVFMRVVVQEDTDEYRAVKNCFKTTTQRRFDVVGIERIQNPFLLGCYMLKKLEMMSMYGHVNEMILFRGTLARFIDHICENNFDWRKCADFKGNKHGKGVSFSPISFYASNFSDKNDDRRAMFLVRVLTSKITEGTETMEIPPLTTERNEVKANSVLRFDTSIRTDGKLIVKYSDNDFYPDYVIYYTVGPDTK